MSVVMLLPTHKDVKVWEASKDIIAFYELFEEWKSP
jgi:hypothetical protein